MLIEIREYSKSRKYIINKRSMDSDTFIYVEVDTYHTTTRQSINTEYRQSCCPWNYGGCTQPNECFTRQWL